MSKRLLDAETRYLKLEKLTLALIIASRKLRSYFYAHIIEILTNYPLRQVLQKPEASKILLKWAIELSQFDISYRPRTTIKGQAFVDFIAKFTYSNTTEVAGITDITKAVKEVEMEKDKIAAKRFEDDDLHGEQ